MNQQTQDIEHNKFFMDKNIKYILWLIIFVGVLIRLINIQMPLLEGATTRQIYNAMVTRHFYEHGLNFLYPLMEIKGDTSYVQAIDAPAIQFICAILYRIFDGAYTEILRGVSIIFTVLATMLLYSLFNLLSNPTVALIAVFFFNFSPISIFIGKSALHEMPLIFFTIGAIYYFLRWTKEEKIVFSILANLCFVIAVLIKKTNLYLLSPLIYLAFSRWGWKSVRKNWVVFCSISIILAWQVWEWYLRVHFPDPQWVHFDLKYNIDRIIFTYTSADFYKKVYADIVNYVLTPFGLTFLLIGFLLGPEKRLNKVLYFWLGAVAVFYLIMPEQFWAHGYYHIHYLPIASFFIAKGFIFVVDKISKTEKSIFTNKKTSALVFAALFVLMSARYSASFYIVPDTKRFVLSTAEHVKNIVREDELIVATADNPSGLLYYSHRKGWPINFSSKGSEAISMLEELRDRGAQYLVCAYKIDLKQNDIFWNYLGANYKVVFENEYCIIVDLKNKKGNIKF